MFLNGGCVEKSVSIVEFGAQTLPGHLNTTAIQAAIDAVSRAGGGQVVVPPGYFLTGSIQLRSHVELHVSRGAVLQGSANSADYPYQIIDDHACDALGG
jgi:polygalacturonase